MPYFISHRPMRIVTIGRFFLFLDTAHFTRNDKPRWPGWL